MKKPFSIILAFIKAVGVVAILLFLSEYLVSSAGCGDIVPGRILDCDVKELEPIVKPLRMFQAFLWIAGVFVMLFLMRFFYWRQQKGHYFI